MAQDRGYNQRLGRAHAPINSKQFGPALAGPFFCGKIFQKKLPLPIPAGLEKRAAKSCRQLQAFAYYRRNLELAKCTEAEQTKANEGHGCRFRNTAQRDVG